MDDENEIGSRYSSGHSHAIRNSAELDCFAAVVKPIDTRLTFYRHLVYSLAAISPVLFRESQHSSEESGDRVHCYASESERVRFRLRR